MADPLLSVQNLSTSFFTSEGVVQAVNDVSYDLMPGQTLGLVGESGSGKSVSALSLLRLIPNPPGKIVGGEVWFDGEELMSVDDSRMREIRGNDIAMVFQEPMTSLNPVLTIGRQLTEAIELHMGLGRSQANERAIELLNMVGIPAAEQRLFDYPHQFSGGMRQRVMIAMALSCDPKLLLADEPTTALDVTIQAQVLEVMARLSRELGTAVIVITHTSASSPATPTASTSCTADASSRAARPATSTPDPSTPTPWTARVGPPPRRPHRPPDPHRGHPARPDQHAAGMRLRAPLPLRRRSCTAERPELVEFSPGHLVACWHSEAVAEEADTILASAHTEEVIAEEPANV